MPNVSIDLQIACSDGEDALPDLDTLEKWSRTALMVADYNADAELTVRLVDEDEIHNLNRDYRQVDRPTNILSFPFECPPEVSIPLIGDLVICTSILKKEAAEQQKSFWEHFAHLIVHGTLHLIGYDHIEPEDAQIMEPLEVRALAVLGYPDPYVLKD
ncbi:MAG: rRNA maturation RNase YbeY [Succinivibrio sp.]|nr:rRNA maturation RNase YbeY [Succinivibrio sp.]